MRIAALEQNSADTEKLIAEARSDKLKHLEEVYRANRKAAGLEAKYVTSIAPIFIEGYLATLYRRFIKQ